ncbi:hypothetical protein [Telluria beijingensis]|uniref:hypothetical protein n=1 Tax=Telluria beijingensis TaxID=3068633 RepID=UPI0027952B18|nr:hypothetical protein [Massilia sp. REN29]
MKIDPRLPSEVQDLYRRRAAAAVLEQLGTATLWQVSAANGDRMLFDPVARLLWDATSQPNAKDTHKGIAAVAAMKTGGLEHWRLPALRELQHFSTLAFSPAKPGSGFGSLINGQPNVTWLTTEGTWNCKESTLNGSPDAWGALAAVNDFAADASGPEFIALCIERGWKLAPAGPVKDKDLLAVHATPDVRQLFADLDQMTVRLPRLQASDFEDPARGLWELWGLDRQTLDELGVRARNPADDVRDCDVAIDFGTSSTVVAYDDHGRRKLLRVGIDRFWEADSPRNYENPTALEFLDLQSMLATWRKHAYRPPLLWDEVRCSHAALERLEAADTRHAVVDSVLTGLKQWAMRGERDARIHVRDGRQHEHALAPLVARNPVLGTPLAVGADDPFDPVELYAWFLGMHINWRGRGIFLRYYMSFPVTYPEQVRDRILASFRRGLQRSLPATLVGQAAFARFRVEELASEPAAYAAAALPSLGIAPTADGAAYAVFDFGGGTTDFEFGKYRLPADEDDDIEELFEHHGAAGDVFLGGERLLENMAYLVFQQNLHRCAKERIVFSRPQDAADIAGHEMFVEDSRIAATNTAVLAAALRPLWEEGQRDTVIKIRLLARGGELVDCQFTLQLDALNAYLATRIGQGVRSFFIAMRTAFAAAPPSVVHVLLAGNASRSRFVESYFFSDEDGASIDRHAAARSEAGRDRSDSLDERLFDIAADYLAEVYGDEQIPEIVVHRPPTADAVHPGMGKTGVALGLLRLCPGGVVATASASPEAPGREAPFGYYVGRVRRGRFDPVLLQSQPYGAWRDLGQARDRVLKLAYSRSTLAATGDMREGDTLLLQRRLELGVDTEGKRVFVRAVGPHEIETCVAAAAPDADAQGAEALTRISLL